MSQRWHLPLLQQAVSQPQVSLSHFEDKLYKTLSPGPEHAIITKIPQVEGLYTVLAQQKHHAAIAHGKLTICELHWILGHISQTAIKSAVTKGLVKGGELDSASEPKFCDTCKKGKAAWQPFPKESK
ncbi:hypothetical protein BS17DRAFT_822727 [Gyrodon lividus]|nr:hypothetical protein BS17DRAFT_822727 [Gyrodon lividus]